MMERVEHFPRHVSMGLHAPFSAALGESDGMNYIVEVLFHVVKCTLFVSSLVERAFPLPMTSFGAPHALKFQDSHLLPGDLFFDYSK